MKLSAVIIAKNEEANIGPCIRSVSFADEVLVIDGGSDDRTGQMAKKYGAHVIVHKEVSFAKQRNFAASKVSGKWVLFIDADERISPKLKKEVEKAVGGEKKYHAYRIKRKNYYFGHHEWPGYELLERLFLTASLKEWRGAIHETAYFDGEAGELDGYLLHYTHQDLSSMLDKTNQWADIESDLIIASNHPPMAAWRFIRIMLTKFADAYLKKGGYKAGTAGLVESIFQAYSYFVIYAKVWEKQKNFGNSNSGKTKI